MLWFSPEERVEYVEAEFGSAAIPTLDALISLAYDTVWLMYYFTTWEKETRAWTIKKNSTAPEAAWAIHTDFQKKFIKAEVVSYDNFVIAWSWSWAKEKGTLRLEGKEYIVQDGDVIVFKIGA
jgi:ribosome-binding ATPase YchF (GTP1/OBG family)